MNAVRNSVTRPRRGLIAPGAGLLGLCCAWPGAARAQCTPVWSGLNGGSFDVFALAAADEDGAGPRPRALFVSGGFHTFGGMPAESIARWDGWAPSAVGGWPPSPTLSETINALHGYDGAPGALLPRGLYVGGTFNTVGTIKARELVRWSAPDWFNVGGGIPDGFVLALDVIDEDQAGPAPPALIVGGGFFHAGAVPATSLARWDGRAWSPVGGPLAGPSSNNVHALIQYDDDGPGPRLAALYVGGGFTQAGGVAARGIARWDGVAWEPLDLGLSSSGVDSLCIFDEDGPGPNNPALFAGGQFTYAGSTFIPVVGFARWDGTQWSKVGGWQHGGVYAQAVFDDDGPGPRQPALFVGGFFQSIPGNIASKFVARWDGQQWHPMAGITTFLAGSGVEAMAVFDEDGAGPNPGGLYVGGRFTHAGGIETHSVARWGCPLPPRCDANCNKSFHPVTGQHTLTIADFTCFQTLYLLSDPAADCNEDGAFSVADFSCFQGKFVTGCP